MWKRLASPLAVAALLAPALARADTLAEFNDAVAAAFAHQRAAIGFLEHDDPEGVTAQLTRMAQSWQEITRRFGARRPDAFAGSELFGTMLVDVPLRIVGARLMVDMGRPDRVRAALEGIRRVVYALRRSQHIDVFADCILDAGGGLRALGASVLESGANALARAEEGARTLERCVTIAPPAVTGDPAFWSLREDAERVLERLRHAIQKNDRGLAEQSLADLLQIAERLIASFG